MDAASSSLLVDLLLLPSPLAIRIFLPTLLQCSLSPIRCRSCVVDVSIREGVPTVSWSPHYGHYDQLWFSVMVSDGCKERLP